MTKLIDFDREFMQFAAKKLRGAAGIKDEEVTGLLNEAMKEWLAAPSEILGGKTPDGYFEDMAPEALVGLLDEYCAANISVPEPLYRRVSGDESCAPMLADIVTDPDSQPDSRATALRLLCDMNAPVADSVCVKALTEGGALAETAAGRLRQAGYHVISPLSGLYADADDDGRAAILDIMSCYPGAEGVCEMLTERLYNDVSRRAMYAALAARFGDERLIAPLERLSQLSDMDYYDYKEIVNAIDALGGEPCGEREFYGDPDYEALRAADTMPDLTEN